MSRLPGQALVPPAATALRAGRIHFATEDPLEARDVIAQLYGSRIRVSEPDGCGWRLTVDQLQTPQVAIGRVDLPVNVTAELEGRDVYAFATMLDGSVRVEGAHRSECFGRGDSFLASRPRTREVCRVERVRCHRVGLSASLLDDVVRESREDPPRAWRFLPARPSGSALRQWRSVARQVENLLADPVDHERDLISGPATRLLAATALAVFPNTAFGADGVVRGRGADSGTLRRAAAFIEANPDLDITLTDVARAAGASSRAVQLAFRRHLATTPMAYLRRVRLEQAHRELASAEPGDGLTVSHVALNWGFANSSRFAAYYRDVYGCPPSQTLRSPG